jgi:hypothetical protein
MEIDLNKKYNYKLRNIKTGKFFSNGKKATWARAYAIIDLFKKGRGYYRNLNKDEWEVVLIPLENPLVITSEDFIEYYREEDEKKALKKKQAEEKRQEQRKKQRENEEKEILRQLKNKYPNV